MGGSVKFFLIENEVFIVRGEVAPSGRSVSIGVGVTDHHQSLGEFLGVAGG